MKTRILITSFLIGLFSLINFPLFAQEGSFINQVIFAEKNYGGPRLGVTMVPGETKLANDMKEKRIGRMSSQIGWNFEYQAVPDGGGRSFVIQFVPLVRGVEYGTLIPSSTLAMGVRLPSGFEFGFGPNVTVTPAMISSSFVMSVGQSFNYGGVNIPLNLVFSTNPGGSRISLMFGYAIQKSN